MRMKIGTKIAMLRKKNGMTQEELAQKLGISAPAVSKWETDSSYPDITLLCPLARALGTNVDTLLQFEETLSNQEAVEKVNQVVETARREGYETGEKLLTELLHQYPNSDVLKFNAALVSDVFRMFYPTADHETQKRWTLRKKELLTELRLAKTTDYWPSATLQLAGMAVTDGELEQARQLLEELPDQQYFVDPTVIWSQLYNKKGEPQEALKAVQKRLFSLSRHVLTCLMVMMEKEITPDAQKALKIAEVYKTVDELFGCGGMYDGMFLDIYLRLEEYEKAAECLEHYADVMTGEVAGPNPLLFHPQFQIKEGQKAATRELCEMLLKSFEDESGGEQNQKLLKYPAGQRALEKLRSSL